MHLCHQIDHNALSGTCALYSLLVPSCSSASSTQCCSVQDRRREDVLPKRHADRVAVTAHEATMKQAGISDQSQLSVLGEETAETVDIWEFVICLYYRPRGVLSVENGYGLVQTDKAAQKHPALVPSASM